MLVLSLAAGCATLERITPAAMEPATRTFAAPMARVKPAFVSTLASMGMSISGLDVRSGKEILRARSSSREVEIELEAVSRSATRARVAARSSGLLYDDATALEILRQAERVLRGT